MRSLEERHHLLALNWPGRFHVEQLDVASTVGMKANFQQVNRLFLRPMFNLLIPFMELMKMPKKPLKMPIQFAQIGPFWSP